MGEGHGGGTGSEGHVLGRERRSVEEIRRLCFPDGGEKRMMMVRGKHGIRRRKDELGHLFS